MNSGLAVRWVYEYVEKRGYLSGWTNGQIAARNVVKLGEELGELAELFQLPKITADEFDRVRMISKQTFERRSAWDSENGIGPGVDMESVMKEIADVMVVILVLSGAIREITGTDFDPVVAAVNKAANDVSRGTRYSPGTGAKPAENIS